MDGRWREVVSLRLHGVADSDSHLLVSELPELVEYQKIIAEAARALYLLDHPERRRVLRGFGERLQMGFSAIRSGSTVIPLEVHEMPPPVFGDVAVEGYVDRAVAATTRTYRSVAQGRKPVDRLPASVLHLMENFGSSLPSDRRVEIVPALAPEDSAEVTRLVRQAVAALIPGRVEDEATVEGEVTRADVVARLFVIRLPNGRALEAPFDPDDERRVTEALRDHEERRVRVRGKALAESTGVAVRFVAVDEIQFVDEVREDEVGRSWGRLRQLGLQGLSGLPQDFATHLDDYLYPEEHRR
jgi:hypothetical protein